MKELPKVEVKVTIKTNISLTSKQVREILKRYVKEYKDNQMIVFYIPPTVK